jgi:BirA family biotin operon repressor/biotin-[acetyl-CoA-carboxylase] ligase
MIDADADAVVLQPVMSRDLFRVRHYAALGSTSDEARHLAGQSCPHGTVVWADEQTAGRGRFGRHWHSPRGNLAVSIVLRPAVPASRASELGFVAAVAVADCVAALLPGSAGVGLKWPNDVQLDGAKIAGILPEAHSPDGMLAWVVLGIGLNLAHAPVEAPYPVTSLTAHGATVTPLRGVQVLLARLAHWLSRWENDGFGPVRAAWLARALALGREVEVRVGDRQARGVFRDLDSDGAMILVTADGPRRITAGEVAFGPR